MTGQMGQFFKAVNHAL